MAVLAASLTLWIDQIVAGVAQGGTLFLVAAGLTLVFGVLHVLNFAHGSFYVLGAYFGWAVGGALGHDLKGFIWNLALAPLIVAGIGAVVEIALLRRIYERELLYQFLLMFGVVYLLTGLTQVIWGVGEYQLTPPSSLVKPLHLGRATLPVYSAFTVGVAVLAFAIIIVLLFRTAFGRDVRAVAEDPEMAAVIGVKVAWVRTRVFVLGSWLAGVAGVLAAGQGAFGPYDGVTVVIFGFVVVIVGGMGSIAGAALAAIAIGVANTVGSILVPNLSETIPYLVMVIVLLVRPWGLLGHPLSQ